MASLPCDKCGKPNCAFGSWDTPITILCAECSKNKNTEQITITEKLKEYFENTPREKVLKDWEETKEATKDVDSPTVKRIFKNIKTVNYDTNTN